MKILSKVKDLKENDIIILMNKYSNKMEVLDIVEGGVRIKRTSASVEFVDYISRIMNGEGQEVE